MEEFNNNIEENVKEQKQEANVNENQNSSAGNPVYQNVNPGYQNQGFQPNNNPNVNPNPGYQNSGYQNQNYQQQPQYNPNNYQAPGYQHQGFQPSQGFQRPYQNQGGQPSQGGIPGLLYSLSISGWATYYGVFKIVLGSLLSIFSILALASSIEGYVLFAITLIGISVLLIISGVKTINFTEAMKRYSQSKDTNRIAEAFSKLNQNFIVSSILSFVIILLIIICIIISLDNAHSYRNFFNY